MKMARINTEEGLRSELQYRNQTGFKLFPSGSTQVRQKRITLQSLLKAKFIAEPQCLKVGQNVCSKLKQAGHLLQWKIFKGTMSKQKTTIKRETRFMVTRDRHWGRGNRKKAVKSTNFQL